ncbi:MAG: methyltransferase domain-containing protein [Deltaproteobacteria bacterium]|jgi:SAM-dependent methyltransferase|nr:methyltransferase domain-containing protein [Deltaproteobacteria bacterium]
MIFASKPSLRLFNQTASRNQPESKEQSQSYWDDWAPSYKKHQDNDGNDDFHRKLIDFVIRRTSLTKEHRVLDLGCGPGRHSRLLARTAKEVTAFDLSPAMIELARNSPDGSGLNINYQVLDWDEADPAALGWEKAFDLTLASRTPALHNLQSLEKMIQTINQGFGVIISAVETANSLRDDLYGPLKIDQETARGSRSAYLEFNFLWLLGYFPEVTYFDQKWLAPRSLESAIAGQKRYFNIISPLSPEEEELLVQTLTQKARDNIVMEEVEAKTILIIWETPPQNRAEKCITNRDSPSGS